MCLSKHKSNTPTHTKTRSEEQNTYLEINPKNTDVYKFLAEDLTIIQTVNKLEKMLHVQSQNINKVKIFFF